MTELEPDTTVHRAAGIWPLVHAERAALAADLTELTGEQWATPSLCTGLTVREARAPHRGSEPWPRPLAGRRDPLPVRLRQAGGHAPVLTKKRITSLRLVATDGPFNTGSGPLVSGTALALTMAMTGRRAYCDEVQGDGAATLRERCETA